MASLSQENIEVFSLLSVALVWILIRVWCRCFMIGFRNLAADDYLMSFAGLLFIGESMAAYYVGYFKGLSIDDMTDEERAALDPNSQEWSDRVNGSKTSVLGWIVYTCLLWSLKGCVCVFYSRLAINVSYMRIRLRIAYITVALTFVAMICVILFACSPPQKHWQINPDPGPECHSVNAKSNMYTVLILNVLTDVYLIYIPIPLVWSARASTKRKVGMVVILCGAVVTTVFGFLRCIIILTTPGPAGAAAAGQWSIRESFVAIIVTNIPLIYPCASRLWIRYCSGGYNRDGMHHMDPIRKSNSANKDPASADSRLAKSRKYHTPYSIPGDTIIDRNESEEQIFDAKGSHDNEHSKPKSQSLTIRDRLNSVMLPPSLSEHQTQISGSENMQPLSEGFHRLRSNQPWDTQANERSNNIKVVTTIGVSHSHR